MDKYTLFRQLMDLMTDEGEVVDADMRNWDGAIEVKAVCGDQEITLTAKFKEVEKDA